MYFRGNSYFYFVHPFALPPKHPAIAGLFKFPHPRSSPAKLQCLLDCFKTVLNNNQWDYIEITFFFFLNCCSYLGMETQYFPEIGTDRGHIFLQAN